MENYKNLPGKVDHTKNIIEVENVSFSYGREEVLRNITLQIHKGDYIGLIGPNGAGKTTLLKIILGLLPLQAGNIKLFGEDIKNFKDWQKIGYAAQKATNFDVNFPATVKEVVAMGRYKKDSVFRSLNEKDKEAVQESLEKVDMWKLRDRLIGDLSGGQQQRVFIARALVNHPEVIFLDEPTTGVDAKMQDEFYALLQKLNKDLGITLILVSHDIGRITEEVMHIACIDHVLTCHASPQEYLEESQSANILGEKVKIITHHHHNHN
jgi:zinc transport system ATP-binding protein